MPSMLRVSWPADLHKRAKTYALQEDLTLSQVIERALVAYLDGLKAPRAIRSIPSLTPAEATDQLRAAPIIAREGPPLAAANCHCGHPLTSHVPCGKGSKNLKCTFGTCSCRRPASSAE